VRIKLKRPNHKYPSCHPVGRHLSFPVTTTRYIAWVEFVFPSLRFGRLYYLCALLPRNLTWFKCIKYPFSLTNYPVLLKALHQVWKLKNGASIFRKYRGYFPPIALIAPGNYAASECRRPAKPVNSTPCKSWPIRRAVILSGVKFAGFGSPSRILRSTGECPPPPPHQRLAFFLLIRQYELRDNAFRV